jgi:nucleotide-binding universal stress UspA family protein
VSAMFKHLLVPLDGSRLAEAALPAANYLAGTLDARVTLLHVIERGAPQEIHGERHLTVPEEARKYLAETASRAFPSGVRVEAHVHTNEVDNVALSITEHSRELGSDLIVMCTHGRGGLRGFIFGRIAQQVARLGSTPVLLVRPETSGAREWLTCRRILVTLDGNPAHEDGLRVGSELARICGEELWLIMAVHTVATLSGQEAATAKMLPRATHALLDLAEKDAVDYLNRHASGLEVEGLKVEAEVRRGDPVTVIVNTAEAMKADLIVLATHGKTGMDAFWSGSVTPNVASRSDIPLLLVPVHEKEAES